MTRDTYDFIVIGVGSMGSSTCYQLAKRGYRVLGLEQFTIPHIRGSHAGQSRLIRKAYFEHPDYVPLLQAAYDGWQEIEQAAGTHLLFQEGILYVGEPDGPLLGGMRRSAGLHDLELVQIQDHTLKYPMFSFPQDYATVFEPEAGFVLPEKSIEAYVHQAKQLGAEILENQKVTGWDTEPTHVTVRTTSHTFRTERVILTGGAYTPRLVDPDSLKLSITQQLLLWIAPEKAKDFGRDSFPCWVIEEKGTPGIFYGFPDVHDISPGPRGLKVAHHRPWKEIDPEDVLEFDQEEEVAHLLQALKRYLPSLEGEVVAVKSCLYANSPDENFIIDFLPGSDEKVLVACGFSGHGFKFIPVVGEILADLGSEGATDYPVAFLRMR